MIIVRCRFSYAYYNATGWQLSALFFAVPHAVTMIVNMIHIVDMAE